MDKSCLAACEYSLALPGVVVSMVLDSRIRIDYSCIRYAPLGVGRTAAKPKVLGVATQQLGSKASCSPQGNSFDGLRNWVFLGALLLM